MSVVVCLLSRWVLVRCLLLLCVCVVAVSCSCSVRHDINIGPVGGDFVPADPKIAYGTPNEQVLVLWVTSGVFPAGNFGGLSGLDAMCTASQPVGTIGSFTHHSQPRVALISTSTTNATDRIPQGYNIVNTNGQCIAADAQDLFSSLVLTWLLLDETGQTLSGSTTSNVYTGTDASGRAAGGDATQYCNDWSFSDSSTVVVPSQTGEILLDGGAFSQWITGDQDQTCDHLSHFYCISAAPSPTQPPTTAAPTAAPTGPDSGGQGDPQFLGLQGQSFQVHGIPDEYFNLLSHPFTQLNSHLTYLATGTCNYNDTLCWSHPGTYVDELGLMLPGVHLAVVAGSHSQGLSVTINGKQLRVPKHLHTQSQARQAGDGTSTIGTSYTVTLPIQLDNDTITMSHNAWLEPVVDDMFMPASLSDSSSSSVPWWSWLRGATCRVSFHSRNRVVISTPLATIDIHNAEHFFNFQLEFHAPRLLLAGAPVHHLQSRSLSSTHPAQAQAAARDQSPHPQFPMHGLIGQTWKNVRYPHGRLYDGTADDYMLTDRQLFSTQFHFNEYLY